jgi:hypothetical protein
MSNFPLSDIVVPANPNVEGVGSGMEGGSCQVMIGLATDVINPKVTDFPQITRNPVQMQYLGWGGDSVVTGQEDADIVDAIAVDYETPDFTDTPVVFAEADQVAAPGAEYDSVSGAVNLGTDTAQIGDWLAGAVPV